MECRYCQLGKATPTQASVWHHITYKPPLVIPLCLTHHRAITNINTRAAAILKRPLPNEARLWICFSWIHRLTASQHVNAFDRWWLGPPPHGATESSTVRK